MAIKSPSDEDFKQFGEILFYATLLPALFYFVWQAGKALMKWIMGETSVELETEDKTTIIEPINQILHIESELMKNKQAEASELAEKNLKQKQQELEDISQKVKVLEIAKQELELINNKQAEALELAEKNLKQKQQELKDVSQKAEVLEVANQGLKEDKEKLNLSLFSKTTDYEVTKKALEHIRNECVKEKYNVSQLSVKLNSSENKLWLIENLSLTATHNQKSTVSVEEVVHENPSGNQTFFQTKKQ